MQFRMPSIEETQINLVFADNQEPLVLDAIEVDDLVGEIADKKLPEDITFEEVFIDLFKKKYKRTLSKTGVSLLCRLKKDLLEKVKKNLLVLEEPSATSVPEVNSPEENSGFYPL